MHSVLLVFLGVRWSLSIILPEMLKGRTEKLLEVKYDGILIRILQSRDCVCFGPLHQMMVSLCCFSPTSHFECLCLVLPEGAEYTSLSVFATALLFGEKNNGWTAILRHGEKLYVKRWLLNRKFWDSPVLLFNSEAISFYSCEKSWACKQGFASFSTERHTN